MIIFGLLLLLTSDKVMNHLQSELTTHNRLIMLLWLFNTILLHFMRNFSRKNRKIEWNSREICWIMGWKRASSLRGRFGSFDTFFQELLLNLSTISLETLLQQSRTRFSSFYCEKKLSSLFKRSNKRKNDFLKIKKEILHERKHERKT